MKFKGFVPVGLRLRRGSGPAYRLTPAIGGATFARVSRPRQENGGLRADAGPRHAFQLFWRGPLLETRKQANAD